MACNCAQPSCNTCTPCCAPNPCAPCGVNPCTPSPAIPCPEDCEIPIYTSSQCTYQTVKCVTWTGLPNACVGFLTGNNLEIVLNSIINYTKTTLSRLTVPDTSITLTSIDDACDDKATIRVRINQALDNALTVTPTGLFVSSADAGITTVVSADTNSINLFGTGVIGSPLTAEIIRDTLTAGGNNALTITASGLYVPPQVALSSTDTASVDLNIASNTLTANVKLNALNTNIISETPTGLLAQYEYIEDIQDNLTQHFTFEVPPLRQATYLIDAPVLGDPQISVSALRVVLGKGPNYTTDYSAANPNVKVFWDDNVTIENSLTNAGVNPNYFLEHTYPATSDFYRQGYVKGYNGDHLIRLNADNQTAISGFKFIKGGEHMLQITVGGFATGTEGTYDFKGLFNLTAFNHSVAGETTYKAARPVQSFDNLGDLLSLNSWVSYGIVPRRQDLIFVSPTFNNLFLNFVMTLRHLQMKNKTGLIVQMNACDVDTLDMQESTLAVVVINNCGAYFNGFINKIIFKLNQPLNVGLGLGPWIQSSGIFDFSGCNTFSIFQINGVFDETLATITPTKILFPDFATDNQLAYIDANQDFIKNEAILSLNNNGITKGQMALTGSSQIHSFGQNYLWDYYNPIYDPLFGTATEFAISITAGAVTTFNIGGTAQGLSNGGAKYNSIPVFSLVSGLGSGFTYEVIMQLGSLNSVVGGIAAGGSGYTVNDIITLGTLSANVLILPTLKVKTVDGGGAVTSFEDGGNFGEFKNVLPGTLTHTSGGTGTGFVLNTTYRWNVRRGVILTGGTGYNQTTSIFKNEVNSFNGTGTGTASITAKAAINSLHNKGWNLRW